MGDYQIEQAVYQLDIYAISSIDTSVQKFESVLYGADLELQPREPNPALARAIETRKSAWLKKHRLLVQQQPRSETIPVKTMSDRNRRLHDIVTTDNFLNGIST